MPHLMTDEGHLEKRRLLMNDHDPVACGPMVDAEILHERWLRLTPLAAAASIPHCTSFHRSPGNVSAVTCDEGWFIVNQPNTEAGQIEAAVADVLEVVEASAEPSTRLGEECLVELARPGARAADR